MKYIKKYENRFTNFFKSDGAGDFFQDYMDDRLQKGLGYNALMSAAREGNWKKFKRKFPRYIKNINDVFIGSLNSGVEHKVDLLSYVVTGEGDLWEKKKMLSLLFDNNVDLTFKDEKGRTFFDFIDDEKLKKWIEETYPEVVSQLTANKYNL